MEVETGSVVQLQTQVWYTYEQPMKARKLAAEQEKEPDKHRDKHRESKNRSIPS